jgi:hypothetical protein
MNSQEITHHHKNLFIGERRKRMGWVRDEVRGKGERIQSGDIMDLEEVNQTLNELKGSVQGVKGSFLVKKDRVVTEDQCSSEYISSSLFYLVDQIRSSKKDITSLVFQAEDRFTAFIFEDYILGVVSEGSTNIPYLGLLAGRVLREFNGHL